MNSYLWYLLHRNFWCFLVGKGSRNYEHNDGFQHWHIFAFLWPEWMGQQMGQHHKDMIYLHQGVENNVRTFSMWTIHRPFGHGPDGDFFWPQILSSTSAVQIFFNALRAGLTNPRDISDSFNENPLTETEQRKNNKNYTVCSSAGVVCKAASS